MLSCGGSSTSSPAPVPAAVPTPSPSPTAPTWTQISEVTACNVLPPAYCVGIYGFTVFPNGTFLAGPASDGQTLTGVLEASERSLIQSDVAALQQFPLTGNLTCTSDAGIAGVNDTVTLTPGPSGSPSVVIFQQAYTASSSNCFLGNPTAAFTLHNDLNALMKKYYPIPFPPQPSPSAVALGLWGGVHVQMQVTSSGAAFSFECAKGEATEPLTLDSAGYFQVSGTYTVTSGPLLQGQPKVFPATYSGNVSDQSMNLTVEYTDSSGRPVVQNFFLTHLAKPNFNQVCALQGVTETAR